MIKIDIKRNIKEFDIAGEVFTINLSDENIFKIEDYFKNFKASEEPKQMIKDSVKAIDVLFEEKNAGEKIYELVGKSSMVLTDVILQVVTHLRKHTDEMRKEKYEKYLSDL